MSDETRDTNHDRMDKFFDNLLSADEYQEYLTEMQHDETFLAEQTLQSRIDRSLKNMFSIDVSRSPSATERSLGNRVVDSQTLNLRRSRFLNLARLAIAASLIGVAVWTIWQFALTGNSATFFKPIPLAQIYQETVDRGFKPYYECHDMQRFADTFEHRQRVRLGLLPMPDDRRMLGLSYLGGLSRNTTAMLCEVDGKQVLVFVDVQTNDPQEIALTTDNPDLNVFRQTKHGLIFYEVSPLRSPTMIDYFEFPK